MRNKCNLFYDPIAANFLIEYRGNFSEEISKVNYACGAIVTETIGIIAVKYEDLDRLRLEVPSIIYVDIRSAAVLQDLSPSFADEINAIKLNPYLDLTGRNVVVGIIDTGINYLNEEFINEDGTSRILSIWDQSIPNNYTSSAPIVNEVTSQISSNEPNSEESTNSNISRIIPLELIRRKRLQTMFSGGALSLVQIPSSPDLTKNSFEDLSSIKDLNELYKDIYIGSVYSKENINDAINAHTNNQDPYAIVPSKDTIGHGTKVASIIGSRGKNIDVQGVSNACDFVIVKLFESTNLKRTAELNNIVVPPVYNTSEIVTALEFLRSEFIRINKPMVIYIGVGSTYGSHDGLNLISRYVSDLGNTKGLCIVSGTGNEGNAQCHVSGIIKSEGEISTQELRVPRELKFFSFNIWIQRPNRASISIVSPTGESTKIITSKTNKKETYKFIFTNTRVDIQYFTPEYFTGHELINLTFYDLKPGIWRIELLGVYIVSGRYDIWLPPHEILPEGLVFLNPDPYNTLVIPSTAVNVLTVAFLGNNNAIMAASGKGFNVNYVINPDIAIIGSNILTTYENNEVTTLSGSSAASAIVAGACALLLEWGIVKKNDLSLYSQKIRSFSIYGATRNFIYTFPNRDIGYGEFNLLGIFNVFAGVFNRYTRLSSPNIINLLPKNKYKEYTINKIFIRIPRNMEDINE